MPAFLGLILLGAVLIEPLVIRRNLFGRLWARLRNLAPPPLPDIDGVAIEATQTTGNRATAREMNPSPLARLLARAQEPTMPGMQHSGIMDPEGNSYPEMEAAIQEISAKMYDIARGRQTP